MTEKKVIKQDNILYEILVNYFSFVPRRVTIKPKACVILYVLFFILFAQTYQIVFMSPFHFFCRNFAEICGFSTA